MDNGNMDNNTPEILPPDNAGQPGPGVPEGPPPIHEGTSPIQEGPPKEESKKKGCLFGMGCLGCGLLGCLGVFVLSIIGIVVGYRWFESTFTEEQPLEMPAVYLTEEEEKALGEKLRIIDEAVNAKEEKEISVSFTPKELNYQFQKLIGESDPKAYVEIDNNNIVAFKLSLPFENAQPKKYLNIKGKGIFQVKDYDFNIKLDEADIGKMNIKTRDKLKDVSRALNTRIPQNPSYQRLPVKIKNLEVKDGVIKLDLKVKSEESINQVQVDKGSC